MRNLVIALAGFLLTAPSPAVADAPFKADTRAVVYLSCGPVMGTAWKIDDDTYVTAEHVLKGRCTVGGEDIHSVVADRDLDFATFKGPKSPHRLKYSCRRYEPEVQYLAIGYAFGNPWLTYQPWITSYFRQEGYRSFIGESIPGMSGGPVIDRYGKVHGIVNMRWPARSRELRDTPLCKD